MNPPSADRAQTVDLPWGAWFHETRHALQLPASWQVDVLGPGDARPLSPAEVRAALENSIGGESFDQLARGKSTACLVVDDLARPTPAAEIMRPLIDLLNASGIADSHICVVVAVGTHTPLTAEHMRWKVGADVMQRCRVECHDYQGDLAATGMMYGERELRVNRTFYESDLKIIIGSVLPHSFAAYSGGAKLVLPGLADLDATARSHKFVQLGLRGGSSPDQNRFRTEIEQIVRGLGARFSVSVLTNAERKVVGVFAGDLVASHRAAIERAAELFRTGVAADYDCVVLNAWPKDVDLIQSENAFVALKGLKSPLVRENGVLILTTAASEGIGHHGLFEPGGHSYRPPTQKRNLGGRDLWVYAPTLTADQVHALYWSGYRTFQDPRALCDALRERLPENSRAAVFPCAPMQQAHDLRTAESPA